MTVSKFRNLKQRATFQVAGNPVRTYAISRYGYQNDVIDLLNLMI
jgi:hypothetical protein